MRSMIDKLDARLVKLLNEQPRVGLLEIARLDTIFIVVSDEAEALAK